MFPFQVFANQPSKLDPIDDTILVGIHEGKSLQEIGESAGRSFAGVRKRMKALEEDGYIIYNPRRARSRTLTEKGSSYLTANGLMKPQSPW